MNLQVSEIFCFGKEDSLISDYLPNFVFILVAVGIDST